jgi:hypothetical protein
VSESLSTVSMIAWFTKFSISAPENPEVNFDKNFEVTV